MRHWKAENLEGDWIVADRTGVPTQIAWCPNQACAERVARALNAQGAVEERDALQKLVNLYRKYGSPDLTRLVNHEAMRTPPLEERQDDGR